LLLLLPCCAVAGENEISLALALSIMTLSVGDCCRRSCDGDGNGCDDSGADGESFPEKRDDDDGNGDDGGEGTDGEEGKINDGDPFRGKRDDDDGNGVEVKPFAETLKLAWLESKALVDGDEDEGARGVE
jgi:hypothetical protein